MVGYVNLGSFWSSSWSWSVPRDDGGVVCGLRVGIGGFARTLAKTLVDPMLGAGKSGFGARLREDGRVL